MNRAVLGISAMAMAALLLTSPAVPRQNDASLEQVINQDWAAGALWNDGKAEIAEYNGERIIYGKPRAHKLHLITVTEDLNREYWAKADWPYGQKPVLPVVKQNQVATIPTPNYPYHYMASVFFDRANVGNMVKMTISSQEWCGTTFKEYQLYKNPPVMNYSSYWDGQGTGEMRLEPFGGSVYFEEELPLLVRTLKFEDGLGAGFALVSNQTTTKATKPEVSNAYLTVTAQDDAHWRVGVEAQDGRAMNFVVQRGYPNTLVEFTHSDGRNYKLAKTERRAYWELPAQQ